MNTCVYEKVRYRDIEFVRGVFVVQCVAVCCSVLQCVAVVVYCSVLQCVAVFCRVLQCVAVCHDRDRDTEFVRGTYVTECVIMASQTGV